MTEKIGFTPLEFAALHVALITLRNIAKKFSPPRGGHRMQIKQCEKVIEMLQEKAND